MKKCKIYPLPLSGSISVPGDKSISQRAILLAAIAYGETSIKGFLNGEDAVSTLSAVRNIGAKVKCISETELLISGTKGKYSTLKEPLNLGNSGTGTRLLAGLLAGIGLDAMIIGDNSLSSRPMVRIKIPLEKMGASIDLNGKKQTLPMTIRGGNLNGIVYRMPEASAQVKSSILFAGLFANGQTTVIEPLPTRDHTEKLFNLFDIPLKINGLSITLNGYGKMGPKIKGKKIQIPGDFSSAAFWIVAASLNPKSNIEIKNVGLSKRRIALIEVLKRMGASIEIINDMSSKDPIGNIRIKGGNLNSTIIEGDEIPNLIDEIPILAVAGSLAYGKTIIKDASELRFKESDRIYEMVKNLKLFGVNVEEKKDGMIINGPSLLTSPSNIIDCKGDHRVAMSLAILNTFSSKSLILKNIDCVKTSYPNFWNDMEKLGGKVDML